MRSITGVNNAKTNMKTKLDATAMTANVSDLDGAEPDKEMKKPTNLIETTDCTIQPPTTSPVAIKPSAIAIVLSLAAVFLAFCNLALMMFQATAMNERMPPARIIMDLIVSMSFFGSSICIVVMVCAKPPNDAGELQPPPNNQK